MLTRESNRSLRGGQNISWGSFQSNGRELFCYNLRSTGSIVRDIDGRKLTAIDELDGPVNGAPAFPDCSI